MGMWFGFNRLSVKLNQLSDCGEHINEEPIAVEAGNFLIREDTSF
jgi:hypothetical protein